MGTVFALIILPILVCLIIFIPVLFATRALLRRLPPPLKLHRVIRIAIYLILFLLIWALCAAIFAPNPSAWH